MPIRQDESEPKYDLKCSHCGNKHHFLEVMEYESHIVNSQMNYVRLAWAETEEYRCLECDEVVEPGDIREDDDQCDVPSVIETPPKGE